MRSAYVPLLCACVHVLRRVSCYFRSRDQMPIRPHPFGAGFTHSVSIKSASALAFTSAAYVSNFSAASVAFPSNPRAVTPFVASPSSNSFNAYSTSIDGGALGSFTHEYTKHSGSSGLLKSGCSARPSGPVFSGRSFQRSSRSRANGDRSEERYRSSPRAVTQNAPSAFACRRDLSAARVDEASGAAIASSGSSYAKSPSSLAEADDDVASPRASRSSEATAASSTATASSAAT
mmetsp:Transcript_13209/g.47427  ORF Transcript_13209/g.47427 Transcript_13209/m.47427 type:complete len:234 (-) Transcript_13209:111-812(-)